MIALPFDQMIMVRLHEGVKATNSAVFWAMVVYSMDNSWSLAKSDLLNEHPHGESGMVWISTHERWLV